MYLPAVCFTCTPSLFHKPPSFCPSFSRSLSRSPYVLSFRPCRTNSTPPRFHATLDSDDKRPHHDNSSTPTSSNQTAPHLEPSIISAVRSFILEARQTFAELTDELDDLKEEDTPLVLGSELSRDQISSTCTIQDLPIPSSPPFYAVSPSLVITLLETYLQTQPHIPSSTLPAIRSHLHILLSAVRDWTAHLSDTARPLLAEPIISPPPHPTAALTAFATLLHLAHFDLLPRFPLPLDPPCTDALSLGTAHQRTLDPTLVAQSDILRPALRRHVTTDRVPALYPHVLIATRGVSMSRATGLLLPQKLRALERSLYSQLRRPFLPVVGLFRAGVTTIRRFGGATDPVGKSPGTPIDPPDATQAPAEKRVRRVVPAVRLRGGWRALSRQFLPSLTQEPCHKLLLVAFREVETDKAELVARRRRELFSQLKESVMQAINPLPAGRRREKEHDDMSTKQKMDLDNMQCPPGKAGGVSLELYGDVPWGLAGHFMPATFALPATRDLLRVDVLTFAALASALVTFARSPDSPFVKAYLLGSLVSYMLRVALGWRRALGLYGSVVTRDRLRRMLGRGETAMTAVGAWAAEEAFVEVACVWVAEILADQVSAAELAEMVAGETGPDDSTVNKWVSWMMDRKLFKSIDEVLK